MLPLTYISGPYTSSEPLTQAHRAMATAVVCASLIERGHLVLCPVTMNHEVDRIMSEKGLQAPSGYWKMLEQRLAAASDKLVVIAAPGWRASRGVAREIALFEAAGKPIEFVDETGFPAQVADVLPTGPVDGQGL